MVSETDKDSSAAASTEKEATIIEVIAQPDAQSSRKSAETRSGTKFKFIKRKTLPAKTV